MSDLVICERQDIVDVADAIRIKTGNYNKLTLNGMVGAIMAIQAFDTTDIPDYVYAEARRVAKKVQSHQGANTITFIACSDIHHSTVNNVEQMEKTLMHMGQAMKIIRDNVAIDFATCLGDSIWDASNESVDDTLEAMRDVNSTLSNAFYGVPNFRLVGNHEAHYKGSTTLTNEQIFANTAAFNVGATFDESNRIGGYCYRDFPDRKLRVICLNTSEGDQTGSYVTSNAQRTWLTNILDLSGLGSGWKSLVLSHIPLDWYGASSVPLSVVNAASGVVCNVHGHIHNYLAGLMAGSSIPRLGIPNGCFYRANEYGQNGTTEYNGMEFGETITYNKMAGTANDTAFCVVTIDFDNEIIYADRYGAGYDRVMTFDGVVSIPTYSVTYILTNVTSKTSIAEVDANGSFTNDLTANDGYENMTVTVTMGGVDITSNAYNDGIISIEPVTGNIVITASATEINATPPSVSYTNLVSTSQALNSDGPYNGTGYKNGYYLSSSSPFEGTDSATVLTGYIPYPVPTSGLPPTIYIKGAEWQNISHCRWFGFDSTKTVIKGCQIQGSGSGNAALTSSFNVTQHDGYFSLTPIEYNGYWKMINLTSSASDIDFFRISLVGKGENLIITLDESIVEGDSGNSGDGGNEALGYTNLVPTSIDTDGNVYNETGYKEGYRLNSSGTETALNGTFCSGFIPYDGEVIRVYGNTTNPTSCSAAYIGLYDASFTKINMVSFINAVDCGGTSESVNGKYLLTVDPSAITNSTYKSNFESAVYIRTNIEGNSATDFIVTLDEEIS